MKFILGTKLKMAQVFEENGKVRPGTVILAGPITVTQLKKADKNKYDSIQIGYGERKAKNISKSVMGQVKETKPSEKVGFKYLKEFRCVNGLEADMGDVKIGDKIDASVFNEGDIVNIASISKGKGFQGVVKRHGFHGGPRSHGQKHSEREPGSIGVTATQRVVKGKRMAGRMGSDRVQIINVKVVRVDKENNQIFLSGAIPGRKGTLVEIVSKTNSKVK
jgi:large subunit ribosomal protein L3